MEVSFTKEEIFWLILAGSFFTLFMSAGVALLYFFYRKRLSDQLLKTSKLELKRKTELLESLVRGQDQEREKIARAIHDELSSKLAVLQISIEHLKRVNKNENQEETALISETIEKLIKSTENISHGLVPPDLEHAGLIQAVNGIVEVINKTDELAIEYTWLNSNSGPRNMENELGVYRIIHELIHNTLKYAKASDVKLHVEMGPKSISILYSDNGAGFNVEHAMNNGLGIRSIMSRVDYLNATYELISSPKKGMTFKLND